MLESVMNRTDFLISPQFQFMKKSNVEDQVREKEMRVAERAWSAEKRQISQRDEVPEKTKDNFMPTPHKGVAPTVWDDESVFRPKVPSRDEVGATAPKNIEKRVNPQKEEDFTEAAKTEIPSQREERVDSDAPADIQEPAKTEEPAKPPQKMNSVETDDSRKAPLLKHDQYNELESKPEPEKEERRKVMDVYA